MPIDSHRTYREKHALFPPQIQSLVAAELAMVVVIPCYDEPDLLECLTCLKACDPPGHATEVIVVMCNSEADSEALKTVMKAQFEAAKVWAEENSEAMLQFHILHFPNMPQKHAGVGFTRKIGMDEAVHRLHLADQITAPIVSLDVDARVEANYLQEITIFFQRNRKLDACSIAFEYDLSRELTREAAIGIELQNRFLVAGLKWAGHPFAFHTNGGAMAVRAEAYEAQSGMNRQQSGEDFAFLQKFIELGQLGELSTTCVHFSSRPSQRKPGGTGRAIAAYLKEQNPNFPVFSAGSYALVRQFILASKKWAGITETQLKSELAALPMIWQAYLALIQGDKAILEVLNCTKSPAAFEKRFFRWFNSSGCFQFLIYASSNGLPKEDLDVHVVKMQALLDLDLGFSAGARVDFEAALMALRNQNC